MSSDERGLQQLFEQLDRSKTGRIGAEELDFFLVIMGVHDATKRSAQVQDMMAKADVDAAGTMGYDAFREIALTMGLRPSSPDLEEALLHQQIDALFDGGDVNGDGFLDKAELLDVLEILGVRDDERRSKLAGDIMGQAKVDRLSRSDFHHVAVKTELSPLVCAKIEIEAAHASVDRMEAEASRMREELHSTWTQLSDARKKLLEGVTARNSEEAIHDHKNAYSNVSSLQLRCESLEGALEAATRAEQLSRDELEDSRKRSARHKEEKEQLMVTISSLREELRQDSRKTPSTYMEAASEIEGLRAKLTAQQDLCFELTNERDNLAQTLRETELSIARAAAGGDQAQAQLYQQTLDELHQQMNELTRANVEHEAKLQTLHDQLNHPDAERDRIEDERNEVTVMRQDMEALQAMVVAQTAQLTVTQAPTDEIGQLQAELQLLRKLLAEAEKRAQTASIEREKAHNELRQVQSTLSRERKQRDKLQNQVTQAQAYGAAGTREAQVAQASGSLIASRHISQIAELEGKVRKLTAENKKLQKRSKSTQGSPLDSAQMRELRQGLADACSEVARLTLEIDKLRADGGGSSSDMQTTQTHLHQLEEMVKEKDKESQRLAAMFRDAEARLHMAQETIRMMREQSCVQVAVKKETIHTREQQEGDYVPVSKKEETSTVTWFTDERVKSIKSGPWQPSEDRVLLQAQLQLGDDWVEMARVLPGRTDEAIANRWKFLTASLRARDGATPGADAVPNQPANSVQRQSSNKPTEDQQQSAVQGGTKEEPETVDQTTPSVQRRTSDHIYAELDGQGYPSLRQGAAKMHVTTKAALYEDAMREQEPPRLNRAEKHSIRSASSSHGGSMVAVI